jgi:hypothetical protein
LKTKESLRTEFLRQKQSNLLQRDNRSDDQTKVRRGLSPPLCPTAPALISPLQMKFQMDQVERDFLKSQERQRKAKLDAAHKYQDLLDRQLQDRREKSLLTLKGLTCPPPLCLTSLSVSPETMAPREKEMNAALFRRYGIQPS